MALPRNFFRGLVILGLSYASSAETIGQTTYIEHTDEYNRILEPMLARMEGRLELQEE